MQWLTRILKSIAVPVVPPPSYGAFHLCFFFGGLVICALVAWRLKKTDERQNKRVLLFVGIFLLSLELFKQVFQYIAIGYERYPFGIFPFHLCSTPMYLCILAGLIRPGKLQNALQNYVGTFGFIGGFIAFFEPSGLLHDYWVETLHSMIWHMLLIFLGFYHFAARRVARQKGEFKGAVGVFLILCCIAFAFNVLFYHASGGTINMFFIGPAHSSIVVFSDISMRFGWYVSTPLLIGCMILAAYLIYLANQRRRQADSPLSPAISH